MKRLLVIASMIFLAVVSAASAQKAANDMTLEEKRARLAKLERDRQKLTQDQSAAKDNFRLGETAFSKKNYREAYEYFKKTYTDKNITPIVKEITIYRLGECAYGLGEYGIAVEYFHTYVTEGDAGRLSNNEFREMALEYMAIAFSSMPNGVQEAINFFKKNRGKAYETQVVYMTGQKNREHGEWDACIVGLETALKTYPNYKDAPRARKMLEECRLMKGQKPAAQTASGGGSTPELQYKQRTELKVSTPAGFSAGGQLTGGRSRQNITSVVQRNMPTIKDAYDKRLAKKRGLKGEIRVKFAINDLGTVVSCALVSSTMNDPVLENAVVNLVRTFKFEKIDKPGDITEVTYPFVFSQ